MKKSKNELWKKSMLQSLNHSSILGLLDEIPENGDMYGYQSEGEGQYYQEYKELFDELSDGAYRLTEALRESELKDNWDDMTVALLGDTKKVLGFDGIYGNNNPGIRFFTAAGAAVEAAGFQYLYSDIKLDLNVLEFKF